jgi:hypothetical protein
VTELVVTLVNLLIVWYMAARVQFAWKGLVAAGPWQLTHVGAKPAKWVLHYMGFGATNPAPPRRAWSQTAALLRTFHHTDIAVGDFAQYGKIAAVRRSYAPNLNAPREHLMLP